MPKHSPSILKLASLGAKARLRELAFEAQNLIALFPHLRDSFDKDELPVGFILKRGAGAHVKPQAPRKRPKLSADARDRISAAQKKRWAAAKKATRKKAAAAPEQSAAAGS